ncbi:MAG: cache domain-containing protein, partial [Bacteroidales bacterium]|nr:cache domain-containing protein [Bacteroidales bacterium]
MRKFLISLVLPALLAIALFIVSVYVVLVPKFEKSMMDRKKEMILELTNTAWSVLEEHNEGYVKGELTLEDAQQNALLQIEQMRYGKERKDYFWLIDHQPAMIMHPYRTELNNTDLSEYKDSHGNRLFIDAVRVVDSAGQGFLEYYWQWNDDDSSDVPKLSFVKEFRPWGWILGTGIYLEDVREEIAGIERGLNRISGLIIGVILLVLSYIIRQSILVENKRRAAEQELKLSRLKYKSLVEASTEGTLMFVDDKVIFANQKFAEKYRPGDRSLVGLSFNQIFKAEISAGIPEGEDAGKSQSLETQVINDGKETDVVISLSRVTYADKQGFIVVVRDVSPRQKVEQSSKKLSDEVEFSLRLMHQSIRPFIREALFCGLNTPIREASDMMRRKSQHAVFVRSDQHVIGVVDINDLNSRVLASGLSPGEPVSLIMTSP